MIAPKTMFLLEFLITGGAAMVWAAWEYWAIRPGRPEKPDPASQQADALPEDAGHPDR